MRNPGSVAGAFRDAVRLILLLVLPISLQACARTSYNVPRQADIPPGRYGSPPPQPSGTSLPRTDGELVEQPAVKMNTPRNVTHEVGPLETVWRLSRMYDVTVDSIYRANGLRPGDPIHIGQKLIIPNAKTFKNVIPLYPNTQWKYIVVHHTATDIGKALVVHRSHEDRGFWHGLGYHFLIDNGTLGKSDGQIEASPRWIKQQAGAHCKAGGMNDKGIGVALVGNFNEDLPTSEQMNSLGHLLRTLCRYYRIPPSNIIGHRDAEGASTECPGKRFPMGSARQSAR